LLAATLLRLPSPLALLHPPQTPYDRSKRRLVPAFTLLTAARDVVPRGALVTVTSEPQDPALDTDAHHMAVALLPGRRVVPAARWGSARPDLARVADYVVIVGARPKAFAGELLLTRREGTVWRRDP
jgi:hypothetical protein